GLARTVDPCLRLARYHSEAMTEIVQAVKLFADEWPLARETWRTTDPALYAVAPPEPVDRIIEVLPTPFGALVRSILHQQVSVAAGRAIVNRPAAARGGGRYGRPIPGPPP